MKIKYRGKTTNISAREVSVFGKFSGLMFKSRDTDNLLFEFRKNTRMSIHSFFVFFPFIAIWLDAKNKVIGARIVSPFTLKVNPLKDFRRLIEIPINRKNRKIVQFFLGKGHNLLIHSSVRRKI